jgi:hypothetical protein
MSGERGVERLLIRGLKSCLHQDISWIAICAISGGEIWRLTLVLLGCRRHVATLSGDRRAVVAQSWRTPRAPFPTMSKNHAGFMMNLIFGVNMRCSLDGLERKMSNLVWVRNKIRHGATLNALNKNHTTRKMSLSIYQMIYGDVDCSNRKLLLH